MKINEFLKEKKWSIISGIAFLVIFMVIAGLFYYGIDSKSINLKDRIDHLSSSVLSLETSSLAVKSSVDGINQEIDGIIRKIDGMSQKPDIYTSDPSVDSELQLKLDDILKNLSVLSQKVESLKIISEAEKQPTQSVEETTTATATAEETIKVPDTKVPGGPANPDHSTNPENQTPPGNTIKAGQNFTVTVNANEVSNLYGYQFNLNYDNEKAAYKGSLKSSVSEISTIFKKDMSDHLLVGATMIGNRPGYSGQDETICTMVFTATEDIDPSIFTIDSVNTVDADQNYIENISGWSIDVKAES